MATAVMSPSREDRHAANSHHKARHLTVTLALIASLAAGCVEPPPPPPPSVSPQQRIPLPPGTGDFANQSFRAPLSVADAEQVLLHTKIFAFGHMPPKRQVQAFNLLLDQTDSRARFRSIAVQGKTAGKLYALCAFLALNSPESTELEFALSKDHTKLFVADSDAWSAMPAAQVVPLIRRRGVLEWMRIEKDETAKYFDRVNKERQLP